MVSESLARRFRPAGFDQPEGSRRDYTKPRQELQKIYLQWLEEPSENFYDRDEEIEAKYKCAFKLIGGVELHDKELTMREANSLLIDFKPRDRLHELVGLFVSAVYNRVGMEVVVFDQDAPEIDMIGYKFEGVLVNVGAVGNEFGKNSKGPVINNGEVAEWTGKSSRGPVINNRKARHWFGAYSKSNVINNGEAGNNFGAHTKNGGSHVIATVEPEDYGYSSDMFGNLWTSKDLERAPELKQYVEELSEITRAIKDEESAKRFLERCGVRGEKIKPEIEENLGKRGVSTKDNELVAKYLKGDTIVREKTREEVEEVLRKRGFESRAINAILQMRHF